MKKISLISFVLVSVLGIQTVNCQDFTSEQKEKQSKVRTLLDSDESNQVTESGNTFEEANFILTSVDEQDIEIDKAFAKGSTPKAEKKAINVKIQRIDASKLYESAYTMVYEAYESRLSKLNWEFPEDKAAAKAKRQEAADKVAAANSNGDGYRYLEEKDLVAYLYEDLKTNIENSNKTFREAIDLQLECFSLYFDQDNKKLSMGGDDFAWNIAVGENTYASYKSYVQAQPQGSHAEEAKQKMFALDPTAYQADFMNGEVVTAPETKTETKVEGNVSNNVIVGVASSSTSTSTSTTSSTSSSTQTKEEPIKPVLEEEEVYSTPIVRETNSQPKTQANTSKTTNTTTVSETPSSNVQEMQSVPGVVYRIQILAIERGKISEGAQARFYSGSEPVTERFEDGMYKYTIGEYKTLSEAKEAKKNLDLSTDSFIVGFKDGQRIR